MKVDFDSKLFVICVVLFCVLGCEKKQLAQFQLFSSTSGKGNSENTLRPKITSKIKLPANLALGMSVEEVLRLNPCSLSKLETGQGTSETDEVFLKCDRLPPSLKYERLITLTSLLTGEVKEDRTFENPTFIFINNRLVGLDTFIGGYVEYHAAIFKAISEVLGPPIRGVSEDDVRKFDAHLIDGMYFRWQDGDQSVYANISHRKMEDWQRQEYRQRYGNNFERYVAMYLVNFEIYDSKYLMSDNKSSK